MLESLKEQLNNKGIIEPSLAVLAEDTESPDDEFFDSIYAGITPEEAKSLNTQIDKIPDASDEEVEEINKEDLKHARKVSDPTIDELMNDI